MHRTLRLQRRENQLLVRHRAAVLLLVLLLPAAASALDAPAVETEAAASSRALPVGVPPPETPGIPSDAELEASGAVIGEVLIDNQNIFNLDDPKDNICAVPPRRPAARQDPRRRDPQPAAVQAGRSLLAAPDR